MKQPTFHGRVLLLLSVFAEARAGDPLAMARILRCYGDYIDKFCTRTLYDLDGTPHVRVNEYMKRRLQIKLIRHPEQPISVGSTKRFSFGALKKIVNVLEWN